MAVEARLDKMESELSHCSNFLNLLVVGDNCLGSEIRRNKRDNILHSKAQKRTLAKTVENVADMEERLIRVEKQVSHIFGRLNKFEALIKSSQITKIRVKT